MLQSRLAVTSRIARSRAGVIWSSWGRRGLSASQETAPTAGQAPLPTGRAGDPAVHASEPLGEDADQAAIAASATKQPSKKQHTDEPIPPTPPRSSQKLEHTDLGQHSKPNFQQKRPFSSQSAQSFDDISCAGLDGSPWPDDAEGREAQKREQEADNKEYFKDHKASPLSEIEFVDSRKPITQATDHSADSPIVASYHGGNIGATVWKPEQLDTAEQAMHRAMEIWNWNKMRGDPDSPHGRVLRDLRGENW